MQKAAFWRILYFTKVGDNMKRFLHQLHPVVSMSLEKSKAQKLIEGREDVISEHTSKLILYRSIRFRDTNNWKSSICRSFADVSEIKLKPDNRRVKYKTLSTWLIGVFGDELSDYKNVLSYWRSKLMSLERDPYPDVEITENMIEECRELVNLYHQFCKEISSLKPNVDKISVSIFRTELDKIV